MKKKRIFSLILILIFTIIPLLVFAEDVGTIENIVGEYTRGYISGKNVSQIKLSWSKVEGAEGYNVYANNQKINDVLIDTEEFIIMDQDGGVSLIRDEDIDKMVEIKIEAISEENIIAEGTTNVTIPKRSYIEWVKINGQELISGMENVSNKVEIQIKFSHPLRSGFRSINTNIKLEKDGTYEQLKADFTYDEENCIYTLKPWGGLSSGEMYKFTMSKWLQDIYNDSYLDFDDIREFNIEPKTDEMPLDVESITTEDGQDFTNKKAINVPVDSKIIVKFNNLLDMGTIEEGSLGKGIIITTNSDGSKDYSGTIIDSIAYAEEVIGGKYNSILTLTPKVEDIFSYSKTDLEYDKDYYIVVEQTVKDADNNSVEEILIFNFKTQMEIVDDATLKDLKINGNTVDGFDPNIYEYKVILPSDTKDIPEIEAIPNNPDATVNITNPEQLPGDVIIEVISGNGENTQVYTIKYELSTEPKDPEIEVLEVYPEELEIKEKDSKQLLVTAKYYNLTEEEVTTKAIYEVGDSTIAMVDKGLVTGLKAGSTEITVKYGGNEVVVPVTVIAPEIEIIEAFPEKIELDEGETKQLLITAIYDNLKEEDVTEKATYEVGDSTIVSVDKGLVTGLKAGNTEITVKYEGNEVVVPVRVDLSKPVIKDIQPSIDQVLEAGDKLIVSFNAPIGGEGYFNLRLPLGIAATGKGFKMEEVEPGFYKGEWIVPEGIKVQNLIVDIIFTSQKGVTVFETAEGKVTILENDEPENPTDTELMENLPTNTVIVGDEAFDIRYLNNNREAQMKLIEWYSQGKEIYIKLGENRIVNIRGEIVDIDKLPEELTYYDINGDTTIYKK